MAHRNSKWKLNTFKVSLEVNWQDLHKESRLLEQKEQKEAEKVRV